MDIFLPMPRIEPPKATNAASPPEEPPGVLVGSLGWQVCPKIGFEQSNDKMHWGKFVLQNGIPPNFINNSTKNN